MTTRDEAVACGHFWFERWGGGIVVCTHRSDVIEMAAAACDQPLCDGVLGGIGLLIFRGREPVLFVQVNDRRDDREPWYGWSPANMTNSIELTPAEYNEVLRRRNGGRV